MPNFRNVSCDVERDDKGTLIIVTRCNFDMMCVLLKKFISQFGNWTQDTEIKAWGKNQMLNGNANFSIYIPKGRHTRDPYTKEWVSGWFNGLINGIGNKKYPELINETFGLS